MDLQILVKTIGEPMRFQILQMLISRNYCVQALSKKLNISESAVSQHLKIMREAGLIYSKKYGYHTHYIPVAESIDCLSKGFCEMNQRLNSLNENSNICNCSYEKEKNK